MKTTNLSHLLLAIMLCFPLVSSAHWIAGYVEDAVDSTSPNDRTVRLWNPTNSQELFGIVGPSGASGTSNVYMIDCELLTTPCQIGDSLNLTLVDDGSGYTAKNIVQVTVTGAGFDIAPNLTMNTPLMFTNLTIEDSLLSPENEIDLTVASSTHATCFGVVQNLGGELLIESAHAELFSSSSFFGDSNDNNTHYTSPSCEINNSYGTLQEAMINCTFDIEYYADAGTWQCEINATDNYSTSASGTDTTLINTLLAIGVDSPMNFGTTDATDVSPEVTAEVTNYGNVKINLTLSGYGETQNDGNAMSCGTKNISIDYMKFNLTSSNSSNLTLAQFESIYENLTSTPTIREFNLNSRQNDATNDAINNTYWRIYVPQEINSDCSGNIVFGAIQG